jgi:peptidyl-prolyl cis-trans isomerase A (cyclophilin A)
MSFAIFLTSLAISSSALAQEEPARTDPVAEKQEHVERPAPNGLENPDLANERAPQKFRVQFVTTQGKFVVEVHRAWSPNGADRFYNLVQLGHYEKIAFFRVIEGFMVQFGIHGTPSISRVWLRATIEDDPVVESNLRGTLSFAKTKQPNSRTTQVFINLADNSRLDDKGFSPFARVIEGMDVVDKLYKTGEGRPRGPGPNQKRVKAKGNVYLEMNFPKLDYITGATIVD